MVGSPQVMECLVSTLVEVDDPNIVMISWMGPGGSIMNDSRTIINQTTSIDNNYTSVLRFAYLMEEDEGEYTCDVTILENSHIQSVQLENLSSESLI